jgi:hypothetical protein
MVLNSTSSNKGMKQTKPGSGKIGVGAWHRIPVFDGHLRGDQQVGGEGAVLYWARVVVSAALAGAAVGSLVYMFRVGGRNPSAVLVALFTGWVLSPFVGACVLTIGSKGLSAGRQVSVFFMSLVIATGAVGLYGGAITVVGTRPAFLYLMVPLVSWVLLVLLGVVVVKRRRSLG